MNDQDRKYINNLIAHTNESLRFWSNNMKGERERLTCSAFLKCLGVSFTPEDIKSSQSDPPDVIFKSANFEITEIFETQRKRGDEYKERYQILLNAKKIEDTLLPYKSPAPISYEKLFNLVASGLCKKATKYGKGCCANLDALVYPSLQNKFLDPKTAIPAFGIISQQGWRSVSFVSPPYSHVIYANEEAPDFLKSVKGITKHQWSDPDTYFTL